MKKVKVLIVDGMINSSIAAVIHQIAEDKGLVIIEELSAPGKDEKVRAVSHEDIVELWDSYFNPRKKTGDSGYVYMPSAVYHLLTNKLNKTFVEKALAMVKANRLVDDKGNPCRVKLRVLTDLFLGGMNTLIKVVVPLNNTEVAEPIERKESNRNAAGEIKGSVDKSKVKKKSTKKTKAPTKK